MKRQTAAYLNAAERALVQARGVLAINYPDQAARLAYYVQFHAAQALIFERTDKVAKTHKGVRRLFHQLSRAEAGIDPRLAGKLTDAYKFKQFADYETGTAAIASPQDAADTIAAAEHFIAVVRAVLSSQQAPPSAP